MVRKTARVREAKLMSSRIPSSRHLTSLLLLVAAATTESAGPGSSTKSVADDSTFSFLSLLERVILCITHEKEIFHLCSQALNNE